MKTNKLMIIIVLSVVEHEEPSKLRKRYEYAKLIAFFLVVVSDVLHDEPLSILPTLACKEEMNPLV